ncbi:MAG: NAD(P)/FAD-dependent oxidoreductase [Bacteroidales bacterium]|nr:NAD(P)/FAD-dependent oxidoreductase [Bacteroidales bacterium]
MKYDIVIIGAGLGGLECGYLLSKAGMNVCVLEKNPQTGGCLQSFHRYGQHFDTGFHYVGGLGEGDLLHEIFQQFHLLDLPWKQLDTHAFDEIFYNGETYTFANRYDAFVGNLAQQFPAQRENLIRYTDFLRRIEVRAEELAQPKPEMQEWMSASAYAFLRQTISDEKLRNILSATSLKMELCKDTLPLYIFGQINGSFIRSAWRLRGGGQQIADRLADGITAHGGTVRTRAEVTALESADGDLLSRIKLQSGEVIECGQVISDIHPNALFPLIQEGVLRKRYQQRITLLPNSFGVFTVHLLLSEGKVRYRNRNLFIHENADLWEPQTTAGSRIRSLGVHFAVPEDGAEHTRNIDLFFPMEWGEVAAWAGTVRGQRGEEYEAFKQRKAEGAIRLATQYISDLQGNIEKIITSTPLTYHDYTHTWQGSAYGLRKNCEQLMTTLLPIRTPVPNLFLTGQNVNFHGVLGVSITALMTVQTVLGRGL